MASVKAVEECLCVSCLVLTKYRCISCETPICSKCSHFEHNEETEGWMVGKAVSYCGFCYEEREADEPNTNMMAMNITDKESSSPRSPSPPPKRMKHNLDINDLDSDSQDEEPEGKKKRKSGRKGRWSTDALNDFIDIVITNESYKEKLIFRNTKNQQNGMIYQKILKELKGRAAERDEAIIFTVAQMRTKFKKCVSDCKKAALTIKTGTGIKRFQEQKGFGEWFQKLFALVRTRDSCKPEEAIEPSAKSSTSEEPDDDDSVDKVFVPLRSKKNPRRKDSSETTGQLVELVKSMIENDPTKEMINTIREELKESREHEMRMFQLMMNTMNPQSNMQGFENPHGIPGSSPGGGYVAMVQGWQQNHTFANSHGSYYQLGGHSKSQMSSGQSSNATLSENDSDFGAKYQNL